MRKASTPKLYSSYHSDARSSRSVAMLRRSVGQDQELTEILRRPESVEHPNAGSQVRKDQQSKRPLTGAAAPSFGGRTTRARQTVLSSPRRSDLLSTPYSPRARGGVQWPQQVEERSHRSSSDQSLSNELVSRRPLTSPIHSLTRPALVSPKPNYKHLYSAQPAALPQRILSWPGLTKLGTRQSFVVQPWLYVGVLIVILGVALTNWYLTPSLEDRLALSISGEILDPATRASGVRTAFNEVELPRLPSRSRSKIVHRVRNGDSLEKIFAAYGLSSERLQKAFDQSGGFLANVNRHEALPLNTRVSFTLDRHGELSVLSFRPRGSTQYAILRERSTGFEAIDAPIPALRADRIVQGVINSSFSADATRAGLPYHAVDLLVDLFSTKIDFRRDLRKGDRFSIILAASEGSAEEQNRRSSPVVLAAAFDVGGKRHFAVRYVGNDGKSRYFDDKGELFGDTFLRYPVKFSRISSTFSDSRLHPVLKRNRPHLGVDFAAPTGTPVRAAGNGKVVFAGYKGPNGNMVEIRHNDRMTTTYLHLSKISAGIRKGRSVSKGETIGAVGCTGLCSGPHLHFGLFNRGKYVDPLKAKLPVDDTLGKGLAIDRLYLDRVMLTLNHLMSPNPVMVAQRTASKRS